MNLLVNRIDNIQIDSKSYDIFSAEATKELNMGGAIVGVNGEYLVDGKNTMDLVYNSELKFLMGNQMYQALLRKPMMLFFIPTQEDEFDANVDELDKRYGIQNLNLNNFAQAFSLACWFIKDSCVCATYSYWLNLFNGYYSQNTRFMDATLSDGSVSEIYFDHHEVQWVVNMMYTVLRYLLPDESRTSTVEMTISGGTKIWEVDRAMSTEGKSFARALLLLQEARRTGMLSTKIGKYCSLLECLFAIDGNHKESIANITAAYIATDDAEKRKIKSDMRTAYGIRSDFSHGGRLSFLKRKNPEDLAALSKTIDDYVRRVFNKVLTEDELNYDTTKNSKKAVKKYFYDLLRNSHSE